MRLLSDTATRADAMVAGCGLDSMSIFFCDRRRPAARLRYLHHHGVSEEAQHIYREGRVFEEDPFTQGLEPGDRQGRMIRWGGVELAGAADRAVNYRYFLDHYSVDVVGAFVRQVVPRLFLVLGAHCRPQPRHTPNVAHRLLEHEIEAIAGMVVGQLIDETLATGAGGQLVDGILDETPVAGAAPAPLSRREREIADLVCEGKQNKQVAYVFGLSEFTVENHLRRIYRKLGVHNRAGMASAMLRGATVQ